ncbi:hypothetical protein Bca52824_085269 [Brassica carinata]|uniref:F-box domain-containing protein n=1 Tax=Brassica carinata TaxID=52824 RepID=A0A8X7TLM4_BRACI|nr:hypothetical protein Bca52824_085269 [Brassica carinata]
MGVSKMKLSWSELCPDLLRCVYERLSFTDLIRAKSVCSSWHSASRGFLPKRNQNPWLDKDKVYKTRDLGVDFARSRCLATYGSWLLMMDNLWNLNVLNPLTGERIDLPALTEPVVPERFRPMLKSSLACLWIDKKTKDYLVVWTMEHFLVFTKRGINTWRGFSSKYVGGTTGYVQMVYDHKAQKLYAYRLCYDISCDQKALILDMGITVVAKDIPGIKRNSIYFSGVGDGRADPDNFFVFDLATQNIQRLPQCVFSHSLL